MTLAGNDLPTLLYTTWLPIALAVILGIIGAFRGAIREAVVSVSVLLSALIIQTWVALWAGDILGLYPNMDSFVVNIILALIVMVLVVLVVGYGLGNLVNSAVPPVGRLLGALLGLANGAAIAGWILRQAYLTSQSSPQPEAATTLSQNAFAVGFIIWAAWFPIVMALAGAIAALVAPLRRARAAVAQPSPGTDWTPAANPTTGVAGTTAPYYAPDNIARATAPYGGYNPVPVPPPPSTAPYAGQPNTLTTGPLPTREAQPQPLATTPPAPPSSLPSSSTPPTSSNPPTGPTQRMDENAAEAGVPSWMLPSSGPVNEDNTPPTADTIRIPTSPSSAGPTDSAGVADGEKHCANCGAPLQEGAMFCTECGTRVSNQ